MSLRKEDYQEPCCPMNTDFWKKEPAVRRIDIRRVTERLDALFSEHDYKGAERLLEYWLAEAEEGNDPDGCLQIENEMMGFFRKQGDREKALLHAGRALELADHPAFDDTLIRGTTFLNAGTVHVAFEEAALPDAARTSEALSLFEKARGIYEQKLSAGDARLAGLYNNTANAYLSAGNVRDAVKNFEKALAILGELPGKQCDMAITRLNLADAITLEQTSLPPECREEIEELERRKTSQLEQAFALLDAPETVRDAYYRFVCEKCAPVFEYYGWFAAAAELEERF